MGLDNKLFSNIVGKGKVPYGAKDHDGDGVASVIDCQPHNPKEQGWIHRAGAAIAEKVGATSAAEKIRERGTQVDETRELAKEERYKQEKETAVYREQQRAMAQRERIKQANAPKTKSSGGFLSSFINQPDKKGAVTSGLKRKKVVTYKKMKGGKYKKVVSYKTTGAKSSAPSQPKQYVMPNIFGGSSGGNSNNIPNLFGTNKGKEKEYKMPKIF